MKSSPPLLLMTNNKKCKVCSSLMTIKDAYFSALDRFSTLSETEIKIILSHINQVPFNELALHYEEGAKNIDEFFSVCEKVNNGYPLQFALGKSDFLSLEFIVDERVLIPRGETEELVLLIEKIIKEEGIHHPSIADICTGSGAIAISLKKRNSHLEVVASDISSDALEVAKENIKFHQVDVRLLQGDALTPLIEAGIKVDYLVANPPYINASDFVGDNVRKYEPHLALFSNDKMVYKKIFTDIEKVMRTNVMTLALEINENEGKLMLEMASALLGEKAHAKLIKDIHQRDRFILVRYHK